MNTKRLSALDIPKASIIVDLPPLDERRRYPVEASLAYLGITRGHFYSKVKAGDIRIIKDGSRTFVPGTEIIRLSSVAA